MRKILLLFVLMMSSGVFAQNVQVTERLNLRMQSINPIEYTRVLILLKDRVDIETLDRDLYDRNTSIEERARIVINTLRDKASGTQEPLLNYLDMQKGQGKVKQVINYWITNLIFIEATSEIINNLTKRTDIEIMDLDAKLDFDRPYDEKPASQSSESVETGLKVIKADLLWQLGITGAGRTVMHIDTGVDGLHPALGPRWWGNNGRPWYHAWFDPIAPNSSFPFDCGSHGTHTMGIMTGRNSATGDTVGVAPDAFWMAAGVTDCPGASYPSMNIASYQWAMDPDSNSATMNMPDVISCSWQDPTASSNQCTNSIYRTVLTAVEAAGIAVVFSAGNLGPGASTISPPKNINLDSVNVFCVGNVNGNTAGYPISSSSSRGPSVCGGTGTLLIKPEVVAPGTNVRSTFPNNTYGTASGTSMAAPHVAGSIALLKQAAPQMTGKQLKAILFSTAVDLGTAGEDNTYGRGLIDVYAAFQQLTSAPLNPFNITSPSAVTITTYPASGQTITFNWDTSATGAYYKWIFGNPAVPPRKITMQSSSNSLVMTSGELDGMLAALGVAQGDSLAGQWDVWAFRVNPQDSIKAGNGPRAVTLKRGIPPLTAFNLVSPANNSTVQTTPTDYTLFAPAWRKSGQGVKYKWIFAYPNFSNASYIKMIHQAANNGYDTSAAIRKSVLDSLAASLGASTADSITGQWRAYAYSAGDSLASSQTYNLTLRRLPIGTVIIGTGTASESYPLDRYYNYMRWQGLWLSNELNFTGSILKIKFYQNNSVGDVSMQNVRIFMRETSQTTLPTAAWDSSGSTMVFNGTLTSLSAPGWFEINLTTPFIHTGGNNLLITIGRDFQQYVETYPMYAYTVTTAYLVRRNRLDASYPPSLTQSYNRANIQLEYSALTGIEGNTAFSVPDVYSLSQNYPNPFNPSTKINYGIPKNGLVNIKIYDLLGKEIATLVNEEKQAGYYDLEFNASHLASGVYFYQIQANDFIATRRMVLIK